MLNLEGFLLGRQSKQHLLLFLRTSDRNYRCLFRGNYENQAIQDALLQWSSIGDGRGDVVIHGESDYALLRNLRNILLGLQTEFTEGGAKVVFTGDKKDDFNKRLILLEN